MIFVLGRIDHKDSKGLLSVNTSILGTLGGLDVSGNLYGLGEINTGWHHELAVALAGLQRGRSETCERKGKNDVERHHID